MSAEPTFLVQPQLADVLARLEAGLLDLEELGLSIPCLHLGLAIDLLRIELDFRQSGSRSRGNL